MNKLRYLLLAVALAGAGWLWLGQKTQAVNADTSLARPGVLIAPGRVEPVHDAVKLAFEAQGRITEILVGEGDAVHAGQVLARLDDRLARARVAAALAGLAQAKARYLFARRGPRPEDISAARADADAAAADARHRGAEQARSAELGKVGALALTVVDADDAAARVATAQATAAAARYQSLAKGTRAEQIEEAAAAITLAQAELDAARVALENTALTAPTDGVILRRIAEVGALVTLTAPVAVLAMADLGQLEIRAEIDEADVARVAPGQPAYATADAYGERRFAVRITRITRELGRKTVRDDDPRARVDTRVLEVTARFEGTSGGAPTVTLPLGLRMQVHIAT
ncbi:MAG TPA: HlyD family efflux transporter periplasmic adaptor subunit [Kofleriaceae bacterium]|jgi:multidrug resistance efflux pump|nr:HlyD family efflux transporter periplasmic adaptor subunit [Kofleriaceae bacterium]